MPPKNRTVDEIILMSYQGVFKNKATYVYLFFCTPVYYCIERNT